MYIRLSTSYQEYQINSNEYTSIKILTNLDSFDGVFPFNFSKDISQFGLRKLPPQPTVTSGVGCDFQKRQCIRSGIRFDFQWKYVS